MKPILRLLLACVLACMAVIATTVLAALVVILVGFQSTAVFPVECGLVFGAAITGNDTAGPAIIRRVDGAAALWKSGQVTTLILTGGKGDAWRMSEAAVMRKQALRDGVDAASILIEDGARSTKENLSRSKDIIDRRCASVVAISDQYHLARIRLLAKKAGWGSLQTYGVPARPPHGEMTSVMRELAAYLYYAVGADQWLQMEMYDDDPKDPEPLKTP